MKVHFFDQLPRSRKLFTPTDVRRTLEFIDALANNAGQWGLYPCEEIHKLPQEQLPGIWQTTIRNRIKTGIAPWDEYFFEVKQVNGLLFVRVLTEEEVEQQASVTEQGSEQA